MSGVTAFSSKSVNGFVHEPERATNDGLVITHGASGDCKASLLVEIANAFSSAGLYVLRCDLAFRRLKGSGPPSPTNAARDRESLLEAAGEMRRIVSGSVYLGGQSYGGRQASMLAAEHPEACAGLLLLSYPLHPPGRPQQLRTAHLPEIHVPSLFAHGSRDPFGSIDELSAAIQLIPAATDLCIVERAGHDLLRGKFDIAGMILPRFRTLMFRSAARSG